MFKWLKKKIFKNFIETAIDETKDYVAENKDEIIEKAEEGAKKGLKKLLDKIIARFKN